MTVETEMMNEENGRLRRHIKTLEAELRKQEAVEPVCWGIPRDDNNVWDVICPEEHARHEGMYTMPLYTSPPDHTKAMRLALEACGAMYANIRNDEWDAKAIELFEAAIAALEGSLK